MAEWAAAGLWLAVGVAIAASLYLLAYRRRTPTPYIDPLERAWAEALDAPPGTKFICETHLGEFTPDECIKNHMRVVDASGIRLHADGCSCTFRRWT